jgi:hypothetical protein
MNGSLDSGLGSPGSSRTSPGRLDQDGFPVGGLPGWSADALQRLTWRIASGDDGGGGDPGPDDPGGGAPGDDGSSEATIVVSAVPSADDTGWGDLNHPRAIIAAAAILGDARLAAARAALRDLAPARRATKARR